MQTAKNWIVTNWLVVSTYALRLVVILGVLWRQLGNLVPGLSPAEIAQYGASATSQAILENPLYLPQKALQLTGYALGLDPVIALRGASTLLALTVLVALYYVLRAWYSQRVALLGAILLLCSDWFLLVARNGATAVSYMTLFLAFACIVWMQRSRASNPSLLASAGVLLMLLYTPGMIWFVGPLVLWRAKWIARHMFSRKPVLIALYIISGLLALAPLGMAVAARPELIHSYLSVPEAWPAFFTSIKQIIAVPFHIFVRNAPGYEFQLSTLPLVSWFVSAMFIVGTYAYFFKRRLDRTWSLVYIFIAGAVVIGLSDVHIALLLPFIILVAAGGIALMLQQWFTVFPRNPFARNVGLVLVLIALGTSSYYGMNKYFVAWPNTPQTKQLFRHKL